MFKRDGKNMRQPKHLQMPCEEHVSAFPRWSTPEVENMELSGVKFIECSKCHWVIQVSHLYEKHNQ